MRSAGLCLVALALSVSACRRHPPADVQQGRALGCVGTGQLASRTATDEERGLLREAVELDPMLGASPPNWPPGVHPDAIYARWHRAVTRVERLRAEQPASRDLLWLAAELHRMGDNLLLPGAGAYAEATFARLAELEPLCPRAYYGRGRLLLVSGRFDEAEEALELARQHARRRNVPFPEIDHALFFVHAHRGDREQALESAARYLEERHEDVRLRDLRDQTRDDAFPRRPP